MERTAYERELEQRVADLEREIASYRLDAVSYERQIEEHYRRHDEVVRLLRLAESGRREYAASAVGQIATDLLSEAQCFANAAKIAEGDKQPLYGLLPSWRWKEAGLS